MPFPIKLSELAANLPTSDKDACEMVDDIIPYMQQVIDDVAHAFDDTGAFTDDFKSDLCGRCCFTKRAATEGCVDCNDITISGQVLKIATGKLTVNFNVRGANDSYDWNLHQSTDNATWGAAIATGSLADGWFISKEVTGLSDGTLYYFRLTLSQAGCDSCSETVFDTPQGCPDPANTNWTAVISSPAEGQVQIVLGGVPDSVKALAWDVSFARATSPSGPWSQVPLNQNGWTFTDTLLSNPDLEHYYAISLELAGCATRTLTAHIRPISSPAAAPYPYWKVTNRTIEWANVSRAAYYRLYRQMKAGGTIEQVGGNISPWNGSVTQFEVDRTQWPVTTQVQSQKWWQYNIWVASVTAGGIETRSSPIDYIESAT